MHYIYKITNLINNKIYIGQSCGDIKERWRGHGYESNRSIPSILIDKKIKQYGIENFIFEVIAFIIPTNDNKQDLVNTNYIETLLIEQEQSHISTGLGYNVARGGRNAPMTEKTKQKLSVANKGKHHSKATEFKLGHFVSEENKQKISKANKGRIPLNKIFTNDLQLLIIEDYKSGMSTRQIAKKYNTGKTVILRIIPREIIRTNSEAKIGRKQSSELIQKRANANKHPRGKYKTN